MHVVAEAGSVCACHLLRREHAEKIWSSLCWPWMLGSVETSRNALETSLRGQTRGSVCVGSDLSDRNIYEARNRIHARNGVTEETTEVVSSPLLVYINLLALLYVLHAWTMCCVVTVFTLYRILNRTSRSASLPYPEHGCRRCRHPCGALVIYTYTLVY